MSSADYPSGNADKNPDKYPSENPGENINTNEHANEHAEKAYAHSRDFSVHKDVCGSGAAAVHLTAAVLPHHIESCIRKFRLHLFREFGLSSARALPPFVPLLFTGKPVYKDYLAELPAPEELVIPSLVQPVLVQNSWFLQLSPRKAVPAPQLKPAYRTYETENIPAQFPSLPPLYPGIFLASSEHADAELNDQDFSSSSILKPVLDKPFKLSVLMDIGMEMQNTDSWWADLNFSIRKIISLR
jgi:hypothetical protein